MRIKHRCLAIVAAGVLAISTIPIPTASAESCCVTMRNIGEDYGVSNIYVRKTSDDSLYCKNPTIKDNAVTFTIDPDETYQVFVTYFKKENDKLIGTAWLKYTIANQTSTLESAETWYVSPNKPVNSGELLWLFDATTAKRIASWKNDGITTIDVPLEENHSYCVHPFISDNPVLDLYFSVSSFEFSPASEILHGDVTLDGKVDIRDAVLLSKAASGMVTLNDMAATNANCNADGELGIDDVMVLIRFLVHYINVLPSIE